MSSTTTELLPPQLIRAIADPRFPALDSLLRAGRHISSDDLEQHTFLIDFQPVLEQLYERYQAVLNRAPEGFFYLPPAQPV